MLQSKRSLLDPASLWAGLKVLSGSDKGPVASGCKARTGFEAETVCDEGLLEKRHFCEKSLTVCRMEDVVSGGDAWVSLTTVP